MPSLNSAYIPNYEVVQINKSGLLTDEQKDLFNIGSTPISISEATDTYTILNQDDLIDIWGFNSFSFDLLDLPSEKFFPGIRYKVYYFKNADGDEKFLSAEALDPLDWNVITSTLLKPLQKRFEFDNTDLQQNRLGQTSEKQRIAILQGNLGSKQKSFTTELGFLLFHSPIILNPWIKTLDQINYLASFSPSGLFIFMLIFLLPLAIYAYRQSKAQVIFIGIGLCFPALSLLLNGTQWQVIYDLFRLMPNLSSDLYVLFVFIVAPAFLLIAIFNFAICSDREKFWAIFTPNIILFWIWWMTSLTPLAVTISLVSKYSLPIIFGCITIWLIVRVSQLLKTHRDSRSREFFAESVEIFYQAEQGISGISHLPKKVCKLLDDRLPNTLLGNFYYRVYFEANIPTLLSVEPLMHSQLE